MSKGFKWRSINSELQNKQTFVHSAPLAWIFWFLTALLLWMSLGSYFDANVIFRNARAPNRNELKMLTFRIVQVSSHTPNFKVKFSDGTTAYLGFPDRLGLNPKGGLAMPQITDSDRRQLNGCLATAKVKSVLGSSGRQDQVWDLDCPQAHIHDGPQAASSQISKNPVSDLIVDLILSTVLLFASYLCLVLARAFGWKK